MKPVFFIVHIVPLTVAVIRYHRHMVRSIKYYLSALEPVVELIYKAADLFRILILEEVSADKEQSETDIAFDVVEPAHIVDGLNYRVFSLAVSRIQPSD